ncbi:30S ribosomal protein S16 [bacterium]|jgi:small subunit ribosomal protein S16|nr:30S ribosomal protein S16 [bacterium]
MAVKIRLSRMGNKNRPYWRLVAMDARKKRDGAFLEKFGTYDPLKHRLFDVKLDRIEDWVSKGAICSPAVIKLMKQAKKSAAPAQK